MAKRKRTTQANAPTKQAKASDIPTPPYDSSSNASIEPKSAHSVTSQEELDITVETLQTLAQYPSIIKSKICRDLRTAVYDFRQACTTGVNTAGQCWSKFNTSEADMLQRTRTRTSRPASLRRLQTPNTPMPSFYSPRCASATKRPSWGLSAAGCATWTWSVGCQCRLKESAR